MNGLIRFAINAVNPKTAQRLARVLTLSFLGWSSAPRWQAGGAKPAFYFGRCPVCRCSRFHRESGWIEISLFGWTVGVAR